MDQYNGHLIVLINTRTSDPGATGLLAYHDNGRKEDFDPNLMPHGHKFHHSPFFLYMQCNKFL